MRKALWWWGLRGGIALLLGAVMGTLVGSAVFGAVATGLTMLVVASVAWEARANRGNAAYGNRSRGADGVVHSGAHAGAIDAGGGSGDACGGGFGGFDGGGDGGGGGGC